jgi:hypothetical protein
MGLQSVPMSDAFGLAGILHQQGCAVIREALPPSLIERFAGGVERSLGYIDELRRMGASAASQFTRDMLAQGGQSGFSLSFRLNSELLMPVYMQQIFHELRERHFLRLAGLVFGRRAAFMVDNCSARRQVPDRPETGLLLHQDVGAAEISSSGQSGLTFWIPLVPLDDQTPTLEVLPLKIDEVLPHRFDDQGYSVLLEQGQLRARLGDRFERVSGLAPGDVVAFNARTIHGTVVPPGASKTRYSLDIRCRPIDELMGTYAGTMLA